MKIEEEMNEGRDESSECISAGFVVGLKDVKPNGTDSDMMEPMAYTFAEDG